MLRRPKTREDKTKTKQHKTKIDLKNQTCLNALKSRLRTVIEQSYTLKTAYVLHRTATYGFRMHV